jgi:2-polyprenyl-6-methoxyphenol hydroxylase-like FAD-dependent oxidoreductase
MAEPTKVIIVGAGLGGLSCAIACRRKGLDTIVLERAPEILPVSALQASQEFAVGYYTN